MIKKLGKEKRGHIRSLCNFPKNRRGLSPVITTVLLIALVIVIISVIFLWFRGMVEEGVTKFGKNIKLVCDDVDFDASYSGGTLNIVNTGNVPIFRINLQMGTGGNYQTKDITEFSGVDWPTNGLNQGGTFSGTIDVGSAEKIIVSPILMGTSTKGKKTFVCGGQYGEELTV
jgi:flagellin-like protein